MGFGLICCGNLAQLFLCEAAGYDIILVETVGVGQSETAVSSFVDMTALLVPPGGGDGLQGIKRGVMELADLVIVNKADGKLKQAAQATRAEYKSVLQLSQRTSDLQLRVVLGDHARAGVSCVYLFFLTDCLRLQCDHGLPVGSQTQCSSQRMRSSGLTAFGRRF